MRFRSSSARGDTLSGLTLNHETQGFFSHQIAGCHVLPANGYGQCKRLNHLKKFLKIKKKEEKQNDENETLGNLYSDLP